MRRLSPSKAVLLVVLILMLWVPAVQAGEPRPELKPDRGFFSWGFLAQVWASLTLVWEANGCQIEPNGGCLPEQGSAPEPDNGCGLEPDGRCAS